jgi:hypothetical protein
MIRHCVMMKVAPEYHDRMDDIFVSLSEVVERIDGISDFRSGLNRDFEGKSFGFTHGFTLDAHSTAALEIYACDETHKIVGGQMTTHCVGGAEGIMVFDIEGQV